MYINEQYMNEKYSSLELTKNSSFIQINPDEEWKSGEQETVTAPLLREHFMEIYINGILTMKVICTPQFLAELVLGRLFTEGIIRGTEDVEGIYICEYGSRAKVILKTEVKTEVKTEAETYVETTPSCCTGNRILNDYFVYSDEIVPVRPIPYRLSWIRQLADEFAKDTPLHRETAATHSCHLACGGKLLFQCEDIGRHNALDKVIGYALRNKMDLSGCMVYTSGRVPTDMAVKVIRAGIPVLVTKAAVSAEAVKLAREYGLTLIRAAKKGGLRLYAGEGPAKG